MTLSSLSAVGNSFLFISVLIHFQFWESLRQESGEQRRRGLSDGSWQNRVSHLRAFITFTSFFRVQDFPVQLTVILRFIAFLGRSSLAYGSASNVISSIKYFAAFLVPSSDKVFESILVSAALKGLKAQLSRPPRQKLPLSPAHLLRFYSALDFSDSKQLAAWCAMLLAFFACLRLSSIVPLSKNKFDSVKHLKVSDVIFDGDIVLIFYKFSKTNQHANKVFWIPIFSVQDHRFNLKKNLCMLFEKVKPPPHAPLFSFGEKSFHTRSSLVKILDKCLYEAGLPVADFSWHSFRRGAATFAFD